MGTTTKFAIPYPELTDPPDGAGQMKALAQKVDTALAGPLICTSTTRPTPTAGAMIFETDTNRIMMGVNVSGTNWWVPLPGTKIAMVMTSSGTGQSIPDATDTPVNWTTETMGDPFDVWQTGSRITPKFPGHYLFEGGIVFSSNATGYRQTKWYVNGALTVGAASTAQLTGTGATVIARPTMRYMNGTTDYMELWAYQNSGAALTLSGTGGYQSSVLVTYMGCGKDATTP